MSVLMENIFSIKWLFMFVWMRKFAVDFTENAEGGKVSRLKHQFGDEKGGNCHS